MSLTNAQHEYFYVRITRMENEMTTSLQSMKKSSNVMEHAQRYILLAIELDMLRGIYGDLQRLRG